MVNDNRRKGFETLGQAAQRLLQGLERAKIKSGFVPVKIAVLVRYSGEKSGERRAAMEFSAQSLAAVIPSVGGVPGRELESGRLTPPFRDDVAANRPDTLDNATQTDREHGEFLNTVTLQRMGE